MNSKFVTDNRKLYGKGTVSQKPDPPDHASDIRYLLYKEKYNLR